MINILESITDGVATYDQEWRVTFVNQWGAQMVGKTPQELMGKKLWEVYPEAVGSRFYQEFHRAVAQRVSVHFQEFYAPLNTWFEVHAYPFQDGLVVLYQDITQRKQAEEALQRAYGELEKRVLERTLQLSQASTILEMQAAERQRAEEILQSTNQQLANILESITDGVCAVDREWRYTFVNQKAEQILQKNQSDLLGKNIWEVYPQTVGSMFYNKCHEALRTGVAVEFEDFNPQLNIWLENKVYPSRDGLSIYFQDITKRKQIEEERNQLLVCSQAARAKAEMAERRCSFISQASKVLASSLDYQTTLNSVARLVVPFLADYCLIHKLEPDGQMLLVAAIHQDSQKQELMDELSRLYQITIQNPNSFTAQVLRTGEPILVSDTSSVIPESITQDARLLQIQRTLDPKSFMVLPLAARGQILGTFVLATAESNRRYNQSDLSLALDLAHRAAMAIDNAQLYCQAQESNRLKDEFLLTLSHELRTPLNVILGWAQMLLVRNLDEKTIRQGIETIERKARAQVRIVYDLLDVSRLIAGKLRLNRDWVELSLVINEAIDNLRLATSSKSIRLESHFDSSVGLIRGDSERLRQVLWNLLSNAIKFTPIGGRVEIRLQRVDNYAQIQVSDTGQGIVPNFLPYVFDRFRQADGTTTRTHPGLGVGLAIVRYLVELHGGTVQAFSEGEGKGATFTIKLPIPPVVKNPADTDLDSGVTTIDPRASSSHSQVLKDLLLLVVDDEADSREVIAFMLEEYGADVIAVASASEALEALESVKPDILISDIGMPELDGYWLISQVRNLETELGGQIPAIALTAYAGEAEGTRALSTGFQMHVSKPIAPAELAAVVASLAGRDGKV